MNDEAMDRLGLRELLRYGYAGFLCTLLAVLVDGASTETLVKQLGDVLAPLAALAVGSVVYVLFRALVGDLFLWRFLIWLHAKLEDLLNRTPTRCRVRYLETTFRVRRGEGLAAYALVRDQLLAEHTRERFHIQHSEGYLLFLTAFLCAPASLVAHACAPSQDQPTAATILGAAALLTFAAGVCHDIHLCREEHAAIAVLPADQLEEILGSGGFLTESES